MKKILLIAVLIVILLTGCNTQEPVVQEMPKGFDPKVCREEDLDAITEKLDSIISAFAFADEVGGSIGRAYLPTQLVYMQELRQQVDEIQYPDCLSQAEDYLITSFEEAITSYTSFMREEDVEIYQEHSQNSVDYLEKYYDEVKDAYDSLEE